MVVHYVPMGYVSVVPRHNGQTGPYKPMYVPTVGPLSFHLHAPMKLLGSLFCRAQCKKQMARPFHLYCNLAETIMKCVYKFRTVYSFQSPKRCVHIKLCSLCNCTGRALIMLADPAKYSIWFFS